MNLCYPNTTYTYIPYDPKYIFLDVEGWRRGADIGHGPPKYAV
jgi:hypothetical protein